MSFLNKQNDSAFYYFNRVATSSKDSVEIATTYNIMATIQSDEGDYYGGQESLLTSLKYLKEQNIKDHYSLLSDYNELGNTSLNLKNYNAAIEYYDQALRFIKDDNFRIITLNNKALAYQKMKQYVQAISIYQSILGQGKESGKEYARILTNLAITRRLQDSNYRAVPDLLMALQIRKNEKDDWGLNSSYAHLSDYYLHSRPDSALFYADKMYAIAQQLNSPDDELEALQKLISLSAPKAIKQYFERYQHLGDSMQTSRNAAKNQFALIRYEAEKSKVDNLKLQKDNIQQRSIFYGTVLLFVAVLAIAIVWYRKRKQRMEWESQNAVRESQLKTSKRVHDVVANGLYRIMTEVEHQEIEKEQLLNEIEILYDRSRDISYEQPENIPSDFQVVIAKLLTSFAVPETTRVLVVGNHKGLWDKTNDHVKAELKHVLQELMVNMKKHSSARNVVVRFERKANQLRIQYTDDGVGLPTTFQYGNGLTNTGNRINDIGGQIIFDQNTTKGLKLQISLQII